MNANIIDLTFTYRKLPEGAIDRISEMATVAAHSNDTTSGISKVRVKLALSTGIELSVDACEYKAAITYMLGTDDWLGAMLPRERKAWVYLDGLSDQSTAKEYRSDTSV